MYKERRQIEKLRRRNTFLILIILILSIWIKNVYDDKEWIRSENELFELNIRNKETQTRELYLKIDSLKKIIKNISSKPEEKPHKIKKKVKIEAPIDTTKIITIEQKIDTLQ